MRFWTQRKKKGLSNPGATARWNVLLNVRKIVDVLRVFPAINRTVPQQPLAYPTNPQLLAVLPGRYYNNFIIMSKIYRRLLGFLEKLGSCVADPAFPHCVLEGLQDVVPFDLYALIVRISACGIFLFDEH